MFLAILTMFLVSFFFFFKIGENGLEMKSQNKPLLQIIARKLENIIYDEATKHNPKGNLMPDEIDDQLKKKLKEAVD